MRKATVILALTMFVIAAMVTGCGGGDKKPAEQPKAKGPSGTLMIYTSIYPDIVELVKPAIAKKFPDLKVNWFQAGSEQVMAKLAGEIEAKKVQADVLLVADPAYYLTLKDKGLLMKYDSPMRKDITGNKDTEGFWTGVRINAIVMAYNTKKVKPEEAPKTWQELLDPKWKGRIAMPNPLLSGTAYVGVGALAQKYGWEYFDKLKANGIKVESGNTALQNKLIQGEYDVVIILEENILKMGAKGEPVKVAYPADGAIINPSPIAIFSSAQNPEAAKALTDWWLSKEGQEMVVKGWMHSVRDDVAAPKGAPALKTLMPTALKIDWNQLAKENEKVKEQFRSRVLEKK
ncbi:MAG: ABC transporter substrate-binding protein [Negativicutes bacterium]|nr:ABC transporter substrate-binding protein [Negativicutes bacterium]